jgi:hypothetical protein
MRLILLALIFMASTEIQSQNAKRIERSASFIAKAEVDKVFPLFGPIREKDWAPGWNPELIYSTHPEVEEHMIFKTASNTVEEEQYLWTVTQYKPAEFFVEYLVSTPNRVWFISVTCAPQNKETNVTVRYAYTSLNELGIQLNKTALEKMFAEDLKDWAEAVNFYLATGKRLE